MTNKRWGRVGDTPVIGAGTWADGRCAVSATGHGEHFLRVAAAKDVAARLEYGGLSLEQAAEQTVERLRALIGERQEETVEILRNWLENEEEKA